MASLILGNFLTQFQMLASNTGDCFCISKTVTSKHTNILNETMSIIFCFMNSIISVKWQFSKNGACLICLNNYLKAETFSSFENCKHLTFVGKCTIYNFLKNFFNKLLFFFTLFLFDSGNSILF